MIKTTSRQKRTQYLVLASWSVTSLILHYFEVFTRFVVSCAIASFSNVLTGAAHWQPAGLGLIPHASTLNFNTVTHSIHTHACCSKRHCGKIRCEPPHAYAQTSAHRRPLFAAQPANRSDIPRPFPAASTVSVCNTATPCQSGSHLFLAFRVTERRLLRSGEFRLQRIDLLGHAALFRPGPMRRRRLRGGAHWIACRRMWPGGGGGSGCPLC